MPGGVTEYGDWDRFIGQLDVSGFTQRLREETYRANARIGADFQRESRKRMQGGSYAPNSPMTVALKGRSKALFNKGDLAAAISWAPDPASPMAVWLGVKRRAAKDVNIARLVHDGFTVKVTDKMRRLLFARLREQAGKRGRGSRLASAFLDQWRRPGAAPGTGRLLGAGKAQQRKFFFAQQRKAGKLSRTGPPARQVYVIPPRPYVSSVLRDSAFRARAFAAWRGAYDRALGAIGGR